jgi:hypothetical protein
MQAHLEAEIAKLQAAIPGASITIARQLRRRLAELMAQLEAAKRQERSTDE